MAKRPIFIPNSDSFPFVREMLINFEWHSGLAKVQAQKSIASLHEAAAKQKISPILEISSKSANYLGVSLSAFNLMLEVRGKKLSVECAYQGSKVFTNGGPYTDLYSASSRDAKTDERLRTAGDFVGYSFFGERFPDKPVTAFYDWLYLTALSQNLDLANKLFEFQGFSDIVFNPDKSLNYQARAAALFVALRQKEEVEKVLNDKNYYISLITNQISQTSYSLEKQIDTSEKREQKQELYSLHNSEGLDNQNSVEVVQSATSSQATDSHSLLPDYNVFNNFFLPNIDNILCVERGKGDIAQILGIPEKLASEWLKRAEELGKIKKLQRPVRYIAVSHISHEQLSVNLQM
jgi:DNA-dependent RNA polymerase auxiliary subunit epsilon